MRSLFSVLLLCACATDPTEPADVGPVGDGGAGRDGGADAGRAPDAGSHAQDTSVTPDAGVVLSPDDFVASLPSGACPPLTISPSNVTVGPSLSKL